MRLPRPSKKEIEEYLLRAKCIPKRRALKVLHLPGAEWNMMINFILSDAYMQPHCHPHKEKIEGIRVLEGEMGVLFFDDQGTVTKSVILGKNRREYIEISAFAWHTYVILSGYVISYETMRGVYDPTTWKEFAPWAPAENTPDSPAYLNFLKGEAIKKRG